MIFIFATAICGYAQEAPAAEQNDDSELILRYQNRRTMRGYKMLFEAGYQWGLPDKDSTISCFLAAAPISNCTVAAATPI